MLWISHLSVGYLIYRLVLEIYPASFLPPSQQHLLLIIALIASVLPDIDFVSFFTKHKSLKLQRDSSHRTQWTHAPLLYALIALIWYMIAQGAVGHLSAIVFFLSVWGHFIGDSIESTGIMWLWPFSKKQYAVKYAEKERIHAKSTIGYYWEYFVRYYVRNWTFYIDIIAVVAAIFVLRQ